MVKVSRAAKKAILSIANGEGRRNSWKVVEEITSKGLARFYGYDDIDLATEKPHWTLTVDGQDLVASWGKRQG